MLVVITNNIDQIRATEMANYSIERSLAMAQMELGTAKSHIAVLETQLVHVSPPSHNSPSKSSIPSSPLSSPHRCTSPARRSPCKCTARQKTLDIEMAKTRRLEADVKKQKRMVIEYQDLYEAQLLRSARAKTELEEAKLEIASLNARIASLIPASPSTLSSPSLATSDACSTWSLMSTPSSPTSFVHPSLNTDNVVKTDSESANVLHGQTANAMKG